MNLYLNGIIMSNRAPKTAGVLLVNKPAGPTSHDVVQVARRALHERAIGHTGTLDPAADGLLLLCVGPYTKLVPYLVQASKTYRGKIALGLETTTDDKEGAPTMSGRVDDLAMDRVRPYAAKFVGDIEQMPPRYAAVKVGGKKLYEYARENVEVEVEPRPVTVYSFILGDMEFVDAPADVLARNPEVESPGKIALVEFEAAVSSGTYVRALARDLGRELGCGGYLASLTRTAVGRFGLEDAVTLDELTDDPAAASARMMRGAAALDRERFPILTLLKAYEERLFRGQPLHDKMLLDPADAANLAPDAVVGIASEDGALLAVAQAERFAPQDQGNVYGSRYMAHFKMLRVFPGGLR
jgi:tRNA pseudouridine55 synthase